MHKLGGHLSPVSRFEHVARELAHTLHLRILHRWNEVEKVNIDRQYLRDRTRFRLIEVVRVLANDGYGVWSWSCDNSAVTC